MPLPWPCTRPVHGATTQSPQSMKSWNSIAGPKRSFHGSARCSTKRRIAGTPMYVCVSGSSSAVCHSTSWSKASRAASKSPRPKASRLDRTSWTFDTLLFSTDRRAPLRDTASLDGVDRPRLGALRPHARGDGSARRAGGARDDRGGEGRPRHPQPGAAAPDGGVLVPDAVVPPPRGEGAHRRRGLRRRRVRVDAGGRDAG